MGEVIRFIRNSQCERARLIREARAIYESIFPSNDTSIEQPNAVEPPATTGTLRGCACIHSITPRIITDRSAAH